MLVVNYLLDGKVPFQARHTARYSMCGHGARARKWTFRPDTKYSEYRAWHFQEKIDFDGPQIVCEFCIFDQPYVFLFLQDSCFCDLTACMGGRAPGVFIFHKKAFTGQAMPDRGSGDAVCIQ